MKDRLERARLRHAEHYLAAFLETIGDYQDGEAPVPPLAERIAEILPQISTAYEWCTRTERYADEASELRSQFVEREDLPPAIGARTGEESRLWADTIRSVVESLTSDPNVYAFLGQFAAVTEADASIMVLREETRSELRNLVASIDSGQATDVDEETAVRARKSLSFLKESLEK